MNTYKVFFELKSSLNTPFQSDTIFGHIAWAYRYLNGEDSLVKWLNESENNPTLISNGFPEGYMPKPILRPMQTDNPDILQNIKKIKKAELVREDWLLQNQNNLNSKILHDHLIELVRDESKLKKESVLIPHSSYNRQTGQTSEGILYDTEETFYHPAKFCFYFRSETMSKKELEQILQFINLDGFGADKSVGKGMLDNFKIEEISLPQPAKVNAVISLSNFIPSCKSDINGYYNTLTKFGKVSGDFASGYNPFKKPVIMFKAGSLILGDSYTPGKIYGKLQSDVHTNPDIVQYGYVFPLPVYIME